MAIELSILESFERITDLRLRDVVQLYMCGCSVVSSPTVAPLMPSIHAVHLLLEKLHI